jgi:D-glycero-D-manno-heptose 1,7-bisphosphate phosphatase
VPKPSDNPNDSAANLEAPALATRDLERIRTVFLDRDGVINKKAPEGEYVCSLDELHLLPGVPKAIARLNRAGLRTVVVSNQRGIAKGLYTAENVKAINQAIQETLRRHEARLDAFIFCPHDLDQCQCRKPLPGMFEQAQRTFPRVTADESVMIGDSHSDIEFGRRLGMLTILIDDNLERPNPNLAEAGGDADWRVSSLSEAVDLLMERRG